MTIEQVASATKIGVRTLHSLEEDQFADLPAKPFIRGFVTSYARFIGLDPQEVLTRFNDYIERKALDRPSRDAGHSGYAFEKREGEQSRTILWFVMGGFLVFGGLIVVFLKPSLHHHRGAHVEKLRAAHPSDALPDSGESGSPLPDASASPSVSPTGVASGAPSASPSPSASPMASAVAVVATPTATTAAPPLSTPTHSVAPAAVVTPTPGPTPSATPTPSSTPTAEAKPDPLNSGINLRGADAAHKIVFRAQTDLWVRYQVDQRRPMKFILRKDKVLVLRAKDSIKFQTSAPQAITYSYNGAGTRPLTASKGAVVKAKDLTLIVPSKLAETIDNPFPGEKPIEGLEVPPPKANAQLSNPEP